MDAGGGKMQDDEDKNEEKRNEIDFFLLMHNCTDILICNVYNLVDKILFSCSDSWSVKRLIFDDDFYGRILFFYQL